MRNGKGQLVFSCLVVLTGITLMVYGSHYHVESVMVEQEAKAVKKVAPPPLPFQMAAAIHTAPPAKPEVTWTPVIKTEPELVQDITVGGVVRNEEGELEQTYLAGEKPDLCPT